MSNLNKLNFTSLEVSGRNYLKSVKDVKLHLIAKSLRATIEELTDDAPVDEAQKTTAITSMMHCRLSTSQRRILVPSGSPWQIALITKKTSSCLKQDTTGNIYASKTLNM
ncbi:hypothetical protein ACFX15_045511 [Malus domestica]